MYRLLSTHVIVAVILHLTLSRRVIPLARIPLRHRLLGGLPAHQAPTPRRHLMIAVMMSLADLT